MTLQENTPIWLWDRGPAPIRASQSGTDRVDVLVVGAGMTGIAAAYYLATQRPDLDVMVVDAQQVGLGATGRSTGIIGPGLSAPLAWMRRKFGDAATARAFASTIEGAAEVHRLVWSERIPCDLRVEHHVLAAMTDGQERRIARHAQQLAALGFPATRWSGGTTADRLGSRSFRSALVYEDVLLVDPYQLVTGLAAAAERAGVAIVERTRVHRFEEHADSVVARTPGGSVIAGQVLLATDGYAGGLTPHRGSVVPVRTHVVATAPLTEPERRDLGWDGAGGVIDQRNFFSYYRLGAGGRMIFGGGPARVPKDDPRDEARDSARIFDRIERELRQRFPSLAQTLVDARWSGLTGGTLDRLPVVGQVDGHPRVHFAGGWCGHGLAMSVISAQRYARVITGRGPADAPTTAGDALPWFRSRCLGLPSSTRSLVLPPYLRAMDLQDQVAIGAGRGGDHAA